MAYIDLLVVGGLLFLVFLGIWTSWRSALMGIVSVGTLIGIFSFVRQTWHGFLFVCIFFALWISLTEQDLGKGKRIRRKIGGRAAAALTSVALYAMCLLFALTFSTGYAKFSSNYKTQYSGSSLAAAYINEHYPDYTLVGYDSPRCSAILPYLDNQKQMWYPVGRYTGVYASYIDWSGDNMDNSTLLPADYAENAILANFTAQDKVLLIVSSNHEIEQADWLRLVYQTQGSYVVGEDYSIYEVTLQ